MYLSDLLCPGLSHIPSSPTAHHLYRLVFPVTALGRYLYGNPVLGGREGRTQ